MEIIGNPILHKVDKLCMELAKILYRAQSSLDCYITISLNAKEANKRKWLSGYLGYIQTLALEDYVMNMCKVFTHSSHGGYEYNSIRNILKVIADNSLASENVAELVTYVKKYGLGKHVNKPIEVQFQRLCSKKIKDFHKIIERLEEARNKAIAHSEMDYVKSDLPSISDMEEILNFGVEFYKVAVSSFLPNIFPVNLDKENRMKRRSFKLLQELGLKNIKFDFDD